METQFMTWAVCDAVNLRYTFLYQDGASGQRARNEDCSPSPLHKLNPNLLDHGMSRRF